MASHAGPQGESSGAGQEAEGTREKRGLEPLLQFPREGMGEAEWVSFSKFRIGMV